MLLRRTPITCPFLRSGQDPICHPCSKPGLEQHLKLPAGSILPPTPASSRPICLGGWAHAKAHPNKQSLQPLGPQHWFPLFWPLHLPCSSMPALAQPALSAQLLVIRQEAQTGQTCLWMPRRVLSSQTDSRVLAPALSVPWGTSPTHPGPLFPGIQQKGWSDLSSWD